VRPILSLAASLAFALGCDSAGGQKDDPGGAPGGGGQPAPPPMPVEVVVARADTVVDAIISTGEIEALQSVELRPDIEGRIAAILVREGAEVSRGTPLFKVDDAELKAEVARAEAERDLAQQSLTRTRDLLGQKAPLYRGSRHLEDGGLWPYQFMFSLGMIIGGGTTQIQKNIIAQRGLGLPRG